MISAEESGCRGKCPDAIQLAALLLRVSHEGRTSRGGEAADSQRIQAALAILGILDHIRWSANEGYSASNRRSDVVGLLLQI